LVKPIAHKSRDSLLVPVLAAIALAYCGSVNRVGLAPKPIDRAESSLQDVLHQERHLW
jgi:hypothetical protein